MYKVEKLLQWTINSFGAAAEPQQIVSGPLHYHIKF